MAEFGEGGYQLLFDFEVGPDGKPATVAYRCAGDRYTLWLGATEWPNGDPIREGEMCTEDQGIELTQWSLRKFGDAVDKHVLRPVDQNQHDALRLLAYNIGVTAFANSTVVALLNRHIIDPSKKPADWEKEIAPAFGMWCKATSAFPNKGDLNDPYYRDIIGKDSRGRKCWVGPDGEPCTYQRAYPGLVRRHLSEGLLALGYQWRQAARRDNISINSRREWDPRDSRWEDRIISKTELADILPVAKRYPLASSIPGGKPDMPLAGPGVAVDESGPVGQSIQPEISPPAQADSAQGKDDILDLTKAAPSEASADGNGGGHPPASLPEDGPLPASASPLPPPSVESSRVGAGEKQAAGSGAPAGSRPVTPVGTKPIHPDTKMPEHVPYRIDPSAGLKPMEETERFVGAALMFIGTFLRVGMANGMKVSGIGGILVVSALDMMKSPANLAVLVSATAIGVTGAFWAIGFALDKFGLKKKKRGEQSATQAMYGLIFGLLCLQMLPSSLPSDWV